MLERIYGVEMKRMPIAKEWLKYDRYEKIARIIYAPVLYIFILAMVNVIGTSVLYGIYVKKMGASEATASEAYNFTEKMNLYVNQNSIWLSFAAALAGILIFGYIYYRDLKKGLFDNNIIVLKKGISKKNADSNEAADLNVGRELNKKMIILAAATAMTLNLGLSRFLTLLPIDGILGSYEESQNTLMTGKIILEIVTSVILVPIVEELVYRGIVQRRLFTVMPESGAMIITSGVFAFFHFNLVQGIYALVLGLFIGYSYNVFKSLEVCILIHGAANFMAIFTNYFIVSRWITNNYFLFIPVMIIELTVGGILLNTYINRCEQ